MYVYVGNRNNWIIGVKRDIYNNYMRWNIWKDRDKTVKITSQEITNQPGEQVGKWKTKGRGAWLALSEREREVSLCLTSLMPVCHIFLSLSL